MSMPQHHRLDALNQLNPQSRFTGIILQLIVRLLFVKKLLKGIKDSLKNAIAALLIWTVFTRALCEVEVMVKVLVWLMMVFFVAVSES